MLTFKLLRTFFFLTAAMAILALGGWGLASHVLDTKFNRGYDTFMTTHIVVLSVFLTMGIAAQALLFIESSREKFSSGPKP